MPSLRFGCSSDERMWWQVGKNAYLCEALGEYFPSKRDELDSSTLQKLASKVQLDEPFSLRFFSVILSSTVLDTTYVVCILYLKFQHNAY